LPEIGHFVLQEERITEPLVTEHDGELQDNCSKNRLRRGGLPIDDFPIDDWRSAD
jgi:hypothetical protein